MLYISRSVELVFYETLNGRMPVRESLAELSEPDQAKAAAHLGLVEKHGQALKGPHVKYLQDKLKELRFRITPGEYRVFFFFHAGDKAVLVHSIIKKTQRTPKQDLELALKRMREWRRRAGEMK